MHTTSDSSLVVPTAEELFSGGLWPSHDYDRQLRQLREHLGQTVFLVEVKFSDINIAVMLDNKPHVLLQVIDFPAPDPSRRLYPHMLVLDDGRGVNLGWIARVTREQPFDPEPEQVLFQEQRLISHLLFHERQLSDQSVALTSRRNLAALLRSSQQLLTDES
jgi:hypothetical protein